LSIDPNIFHQVGPEFDVDSKNQIKNVSSHLKNYVWFVAQIWDTLYIDGLSRNNLDTNNEKIDIK